MTRLPQPPAATPAEPLARPSSPRPAVPQEQSAAATAALLPAAEMLLARTQAATSQARMEAATATGQGRSAAPGAF